MTAAEAKEVARVAGELGVILGIMKEESNRLEAALDQAQDDFQARKRLFLWLGWKRAIARLEQIPIEAKVILKDLGDTLYQ